MRRGLDKMSHSHQVKRFFDDEIAFFFWDSSDLQPKFKVFVNRGCKENGVLLYHYNHFSKGLKIWFGKLDRLRLINYFSGSGGLK